MYVTLLHKVVHSNPKTKPLNQRQMFSDNNVCNAQIIMENDSETLVTK